MDHGARKRLTQKYDLLTDPPVYPLNNTDFVTF